MSADWQVYEEVARRVLLDIRSVLGLARVEGKQDLGGASGAIWEIDAKAWREGQDGFLVVEVRRYASARLKQEDLGAIAYRIKDVGGSGGIVVSPLPLQKGAALVAGSSGIEHVRLSSDSTLERYLAEYMGRKFHGLTLTATAHASATVELTVIRKGDDGT